MNKILKISFKNAKLFPFNRNGKDFVSDQNIRSKRNEQLMFKEPITVYQISNMLHKMMGERPVPSFRYVGYKQQNDIFELAQNSYLKINSVRQFNKNKKRDEFVKELTQVKKSVNNGWNKVPVVFWGKVKTMMDENFNEFIDKFSKLMGCDVLIKPFMSFKNCGVNNENFNELILWLKSIGKTPISNFISKENFDLSEITKNGTIGETTVRGIASTNSLSGIIYVPVNNEQLKRFIFNTVTILDGGLATIENVYYQEDLSYDELDDFRLVSEITNEKEKEIVW